MAIIEVNWHPGRKDLRVFGTGALVATLILAAVLHYRRGLDGRWALSIALFGALIFVSSFLLPRAAKIVYSVMMCIALPIGLVLSFLLMGVFYYLILTPTGIVFRLMGRDLLNLKRKHSAESYWVKRRVPDSLKRYFHQF
jgi:hypothetical protein